MLEAWKQFVDGQPVLNAPPKAILESWERCKAFEVATARAQLRRIPLPDLQERLAREAAFVQAAQRHLVWALAAMAPLHPVIVILADRDGIVLHSIGNAPEAMVEFGLVPGYDWSERAMGTNGIGTALSFGAPVAVVGAEHFVETWHNNTCVGAPVRGPDGAIRGAVDISTTAADGDPARLVLVAFLAHVISLELGRAEERSYATDDLLERASSQGSSARRRDLEDGARALALLEQDLILATREDRASAAGKETTALDPLLRGVVEGLHDARLGELDTGAPAQLMLVAPHLFHRALTHLTTLLLRGGASPIEVSTRAGATSLVVGIHGAAGRAPPANNLDRAGTALGEWLATQLLAVSGATLERDEAPGRPGYLVRVPLRT